jgi:hypothetical protein
MTSQILTCDRARTCTTSCPATPLLLMAPAGMYTTHSMLPVADIKHSRRWGRSRV